MKYFGEKTIFQGRAYSVREKLVLFFTSQQKAFTDIKGPPFDYPMEYLHEGDRKLMIRIGLQDDDFAKKIFSELKNSGLKVVWVSNTLPFILYITAGYLATFIVGDVMFLLLNYLL